MRSRGAWEEGRRVRTRDNGFRRDALESQQTAVDGMACGWRNARRCAHRGEIIGRLNMRGGSRTERCAESERAAWFRCAANSFQRCAAMENRQELGRAAAFLIGVCSLALYCARRQCEDFGHTATFIIGTVHSLALYHARRQREYLGRGGGLTGGTVRESAAPDRRSGPSGAKDAARQAEQSAI